MTKHEMPDDEGMTKSKLCCIKGAFSLPAWGSPRVCKIKKDQQR